MRHGLTRRLDKDGKCDAPSAAKTSVLPSLTDGIVLQSMEHVGTWSAVRQPGHVVSAACAPRCVFRATMRFCLLSCGHRVSERSRR